MIVLGIESSAHTFGAGVVDNGHILSNEKSMYRITGKGMIPARVADFHAMNAGRIIKRSLRSAGVGIGEIDAIGYTKGPGLGACLQVGLVAARGLSMLHNKPLIPVNHGAAHVEIVKSLYGLEDPLALYVSGGNSQILAAVDNPFKHYHIYGETFDIGVGNMIDNFARAAKMNPAWGSTVQKMAGNGKYVKMPYTVKGMDFTFTGLLTHATNLLGSHSVRDVSYSILETAFAMLCEATERALFLTRKKSMVLCGGVAQSKRLREMLEIVADSHGIEFAAAQDEYNADNGAMIAVAAERLARSGLRFKSRDCTVSQKYRIDRAVIA